MNGDRTRRVNLDRQIPVVICYTTAVVWPDGKVGFFEDVDCYGPQPPLDMSSTNELFARPLMVLKA